MFRGDKSRMMDARITRYVLSRDSGLCFVATISSYKNQIQTQQEGSVSRSKVSTSPECQWQDL